MSYYIRGYMPPDFIRDSEDVKRYQQALGVEADGIWGRKTQDAYEKWQGNSREYALESEKNAYHRSIDVVPDMDTDDYKDWSETAQIMREYLERFMRPATDAAIEAREDAAESNMAEMDADAAARGMQGSTFVSSLKAREMEEAQADIADIEGDYMAALSAQLYESMFDLYESHLEQERYEAELEMERERLELEKRAFYSANSGSSGRSGSGSSSDTEDIAVPDITYQECYDLLGYLGDEAYDFLNSNTAYWTRCRAEVRAALGDSEYERLIREFFGTSGSNGNGNGGGGGRGSGSGGNGNASREMRA